MASQKQQEDSNATQTSEALPAPVLSEAVPSCNPNNQSNSLENHEQQSDSKAFHLCVEGTSGMFYQTVQVLVYFHFLFAAMKIIHHNLKCDFILFFMFWKEVSDAYQGCIYLIKS